MANYYPVPYQQNWGYGGVGQQMYPQYQSGAMGQQTAGMGMGQPGQNGQNGPGLIWVDGEVGAKAFQMPAGFPAGQPIALWDTNDTVIYLKSTNPMGMPNPLQKAHYRLENAQENRNGVFSGDTGAREADSEYVRKDDMERMKQELMDAISGMSGGMSGTATGGNAGMNGGTNAGAAGGGTNATGTATRRNAKGEQA